MKPERVIVCPKCRYTSGNDWRQCHGSCPMPMSPHYMGRWNTFMFRVHAALNWLHSHRIRVIIERIEDDE